MSTIQWSHPSVKKFAPKTDPVAAIIKRAKEVVLDALEKGWSGPPFDPFALAEMLKIQVVPTQDIADARTVPLRKGRIRIEFNPDRRAARIRFSIAHEIAHTLFPDCDENVRERLERTKIKKDDWQLEMLCNLGASEILMPTGSFPALGTEQLSIDRLMRLRQEYGVSSEATLLRVARLTDLPAAMFAAPATQEDAQPRNYRVDYSVASLAWNDISLTGIVPPNNSCISHCTAIGYTANCTERWNGVSSLLHVECVGIAPHVGRRLPRVVGVVSPENGATRNVPRIQYVKGSALQPRGEEYRIIGQVMNDVSPTWGGGFAVAVRNKWPKAQDDYRTWVHQLRTRPKLGSHHFFQVEPDIGVFTIIAQEGLGPSSKRRIRYNALAQGLACLTTKAVELGASVHMPRIGCGQAGGSWDVVSELIHDTLTRAGIAVTVYDLPGQDRETNKTLFD